MNLKQVVVSVMAIIAATIGWADTVVFPTTGKDLANPTDWERTAIPGTADVIQLGSSSADQTVTASADVEFGGISVLAQSHNVIFDMRESVSQGAPRKIKMNGNAQIGNSGSAPYYTKYFLRGGYWDFGANSVGIGTASYYKTPQGSKLTIDGGAVVVCNMLIGGYQFDEDKPGLVTVTGEGTVVTTKYLYVSTPSGRYNQMVISDGAKVFLSGATANGVFSIDGKAARNNRLIVTNGAQIVHLSGTKTCYHGQKGGANELFVEADSLVNLSGASAYYLGHSDGQDANTFNDNRIMVRGENAELKLPGVYQGNASGVAAREGNCNSVVSVCDGGKLAGAKWYLNGHDNGFIISNGTVQLTSGGIQCKTSTNCYVRMQGAHPSFVTTATGTSEYKDSFRFIFDLPAEGYDGTVDWPIDSTATTSFDATVSVEVNGCAEVLDDMKAKDESKRIFNLARFANNCITAEHLARWNATLPDYAKLSFADNKLTLTVKNKRGLILLFK